MNTTERKRLRELAEKATPGEWQAGYSDGSGKELITTSMGKCNAISTTNWGCSCCEGDPTEQNFMDADFIAAARTAVPQLLDLVEEMEEMLVSIMDIGRTGDGTTTECEMTYLADDILQKLRGEG